METNAPLVGVARKLQHFHKQKLLWMVSSGDGIMHLEMMLYTTIRYGMCMISPIVKQQDESLPTHDIVHDLQI